MFSDNHFSNAKSWPFEEARKIIERLKTLAGKDCVVLETGYGPSGLPHIGTFGEVLRTTLVMRAFRRLSNNPAKLFVFSDDMDGLRKVPANVPNSEQLEAHLEKPLTSVPDPFGQYESFAHHNNAMLRRFLDSFEFEYEFKSSTEMYKSGVFNEYLSKILIHYEEIMNIMLPSLREERQKTYSPFLPICPKTGKVLQVPIIEMHPNRCTIVYEDPETGNLEEISILDGYCKLQWKADWGMRWAALGVDYEMNGKDLIDSFKLSSKICKIIGGRPPENLTYELFLDEGGKKISKSKGNGLSMDEWLKYASPESLAYYMYQSPKRAKRLYFDVIPSAMDDYIDSVRSYYASGNDNKILDSPVFHIHNGNPPRFSNCLKFSMLLNLVQACNTADENVLMEFVRKYVDESSESDETMGFLRKMVKFAITYYKDFVMNTRKFIVPDDLQRRAITELRNELERMDCRADADDFQTKVFEIGKRFFKDDMRGWFKTLYGFLFGFESGPKLGSFIHLYGVNNTINLIKNKELANVE
ncbi:MAG: lysine--tRNA ligase [Holosporales bacterium]|jgi:lysyl-tRNA synthetase class 1|nr:lysine--tRNA ligase [Holosporales bacterium]